MTNSDVTYIPELDYAARNYKPFGEAPSMDLCNRCELYYKKLFDLGLTNTPFPPECSKHISNQTQEWVLEDFESEEEFESAKIAADPVAWAYSEFGWEPRWFQEEVLSCTSKKKIMRCGRRSGKTQAMIIGILHHLFTNSHHRVLVVAPYERQVGVIFDELRKLISISRNLRNSIARDIKNPSRLELNNGSVVMGFSSGSKTAAKSDKIRGQDAHMIVLDELDYIADEDLDAIMAILVSHPDCDLWAASTPSGEHRKFYAYCTDKNLTFKEFWYISAESPNWTDKQEYFLKKTYSEAAFKHEFLAEFAEQEAGVFKNSHIDLALRQYNMDSIAPIEGAKYALGVDWNSNAGCHMVIVQVNGEVFQVVRKIIVPASEFTQTQAVDKILLLDGVWGFRTIYVDAGYGTTQIEMLRRHAMKMPGSFLAERLHGIAMNQSIDIIDPITGAAVKKPAKPFIVNLLAKALEDGRLVLPRSEDTRTITTDMQMGLVQQMRNFRIEGYSILGLPKFSQGQDHTLTALMLAVAGYMIEFGDLKFVNYSTRVGFGPGFGERSVDPSNNKVEEIRQGMNQAAARDLNKESPIGYADRSAGSVREMQKRKKLFDQHMKTEKGSQGYIGRKNLGNFNRKSF